MPPLEQELPTDLHVYDWDEIRKHDKEDDAWVVKDGQVYDVSKFLKEHPGGSSIVLPHLGSDIGKIFMDADMHEHSKAAHSMMARYRIGVLEGAAVRKLETNKFDAVYKFDWNKPIVFQVGHLGEHYNEFIHTPHVLDEPARFFDSDFLEMFSRTPWYVVPLVWVPVITGMLVYANKLGVSSEHGAAIFVGGLALWTLIEYVLHRWLFHLDEHLPNTYSVLTVHFLLHGVHHLLPMDAMRLVFPPVLTTLLLIPFYNLFRCLLDTPEAVCLTAGGLTGYMIYDLTHYYLHHSGKPFHSHFGSMKTYHLAHHYKNPTLGYGITSKFWDYAFGTVLDDSPTGFKTPLEGKGGKAH